jgi:hypothetical protein
MALNIFSLVGTRWGIMDIHAPQMTWISGLPSIPRMLSAWRRCCAFGFDTPDLSPDLFLQDHSIVRMGVPPIRIEVLTTISGVQFAACYAERIVATIDGVDVNLISLHYLKVNKQASGRYKDLDDIEHLP